MVGRGMGMRRDREVTPNDLLALHVWRDYLSTNDFSSSFLNLAPFPVSHRSPWSLVAYIGKETAENCEEGSLRPS